MTKEKLITLLLDSEQTGLAVDELHRLIEKYPYFHTGHQLYLKALQQTDANRMTFQLRKTALCVRDRSVLYNYINRPPASHQQLKKIAPPQTEEVQTEASRETSDIDLIELFLKSNPKIKRNEDNNYEVDLSESLRENPDIATDRLADIYAWQGHIGKAIEIYEHLILKYPEKHIYFAAQIERLKVQK